MNGLVQRIRPESSCLATIPSGWVDTRSITDLRPEDIPDSGQCHFFAGIGGWGLAFRLAGIPDDAHAWSASLPCQPFSVSGSRKGTADDRHLFPVFHRLVCVKRPPIIFGEQVASADGLEWLAGVHTAMEAEGYLFGASCLPAACVGAPHKRERIFWGAVLPSAGFIGCRAGRGDREERSVQSDGERVNSQSEPEREGWKPGTGTGPDCFANGLLNPISVGCTGQSWRRSGSVSQDGCPDVDAWGDHFQRWADGTTRRTEPGLLPLAHGFPERVGLIRGFGNAIVPAVAAKFITAFIGAIEDTKGSW